MKLRIFNPEHDIALSANDTRFTAPHAGRKLRGDLDFLPALWADEGDFVLVDDVERAQRSLRCYSKYLHHSVCFVDSSMLRSLDFTGIDPWGWDLALWGELGRLGVAEARMPSHGQLAAIRDLSNRGWAADHLLPALLTDGTVGQAFIAHTLVEVKDLFRRFGSLVVKAPWSSSGRGVRYVLPDSWDDRLEGWLRNVLQRQLTVEVEPLYNKVRDFALEFFSDENGVRFAGYSLFHTTHGAYTGNVLATTEAKEAMLSRYLPIEVVRSTAARICQVLSESLRGVYHGPLGVDMMVVAGQGRLLLHPCVELNLRRTMGHVGLSLSPTEREPWRLMRVQFQNGRYHFRVTDTHENVLDRDVY